MAVYTVHEPPPKSDGQTSDPERFEFVRDGFSFWAFVFGPLWMLRHRMWLVLLGYVGVSAALELVFSLLSVSAVARPIAGFFLALLVGIESATLRRYSLARGRWINLRGIVADDLEPANRRFYAVGVSSAGAAPRTTAQARPPAAVPDVTALFPQPGPRR